MTEARRRGRSRLQMGENINESKRAQEELRLLDRAVTASTNSITVTDPN